MIKIKKNLDGIWTVDFNGEVREFNNERDARAYVEKIKKQDPIERWRADRYEQVVRR